jgi:hypothetical protein
VDTFGFLLGSWALDRSIEDHRSGIKGWFRGTATLTLREQQPVPRGAPRPGARYEELGELSFGSALGPAVRILDYLRIDATAVRVSFTDGRPFLDLNLETGAWQGDHRCGEDRHELATFVRSPDVIEECWRVRGPATAYDAATVLRRQPADS